MDSFEAVARLMVEHLRDLAEHLAGHADRYPATMRAALDAIAQAEADGLAGPAPGQTTGQTGAEFGQTIGRAGRGQAGPAAP